ncbi:claudin-23-like [Brienomyrus brachyistius]|uniref:claudin-23-like n=1 Tax=Brienomyrus brachyistius TaxID=42636 RepID=UPI0020B38522|nr:claudin-23-like [Brienomyrus brachyistius]
MRTPGLHIFGMVFAPCGLVLDLTSTVAPNWRVLSSIPNQASDVILQQGIWDICQASTITTTVTCSQPDVTYFSQQIIPVAKGLMIASLLVTLLGIAVATAGVRCWRDRPNWIIAGIGGIFIFLSGVMTLIPISWYTNVITTIPSVTQSIAPGYCIVLGFIGGIMEVLSGAALVIGMCSCCGGWNRGERRSKIKTTYFHNRAAVPRRIEVPNISRTRSDASSVPYSRDTLDDRDFPRAKTPGRINTTYSSKMGDADL